MDLKFEDLTSELIIDLAKQALYEYDDDWSQLKDEYLKLVCIDMMDKFKSMPEIERNVALLTSTITLMVENHFLHTKLLRKDIS